MNSDPTIDQWREYCAMCQRGEFPDPSRFDHSPVNWRDLPPTEAQLRCFAPRRGREQEPLPKTRGEASDRIQAGVDAKTRRDEYSSYEDDDLPF